MVKSTFNKEKAIQAVLYVTNKLLRKDFHIIFKILYFADRKHLADWGTTITGDAYNQDTDGLGNFFGIEGWMYVIPKQEADTRKLSASDIETLNGPLMCTDI